MKRLFILRHGEADWKASQDSQRNLSEYGTQQAAKIATWLFTQDIQPEIFVSPYLRAQQTAEQLALKNPTFRLTTLDLITPSGNLADLCAFLEKRKAADVMIVSHQPLVSTLTSLLIDGHSNGFRDLTFTPACLAVLETEAYPGLAVLKEFISPESL